MISGTSRARRQRGQAAAAGSDGAPWAFDREGGDGLPAGRQRAQRGRGRGTVEAGEAHHVTVGISDSRRARLGCGPGRPSLCPEFAPVGHAEPRTPVPSCDGASGAGAAWRMLALLSEARTVGDESCCTGQHDTVIAGVGNRHAGGIRGEFGQAGRHERNMVSHNRICRAASQRLRGPAETAREGEKPDSHKVLMHDGQSATRRIPGTGVEQLSETQAHTWPFA